MQHSLYNLHYICCKPRKLVIILTDTDFTALINFLFSRIFSILLSCVGIKLDLNLMSRIQIPLLPASTMILYTIFSSLSPPFTFWAVEGSFSLYRSVPPWLNKSKYPWNKRINNYPHTTSGGEYVHRIQMMQTVVLQKSFEFNSLSSINEKCLLSNVSSIQHTFISFHS